MSLSLSHDCRDCGMKFDDATQLANHVKFFCKDSGYGNQADLDHKLAKLGVNENPHTVLSISDIKHYLRGDDESKAPIASQVKNLSLDELRGHFQARQSHQEDLQRMVARKKESDMVSEVEHFKREREKLRLLKKQDEEVLLDLMQEMEKKKERELRADIEKEQIRKALKDVQRQKLTELQKDKKRELERLAAERENLRLKESEIMDEIKSLEGNLKDQQRRLEQDRKNIKDKRGIGVPSAVNEWQQKQIQFAQERGEKVVALKQKREILEAERERIMGQLESVKDGDLSYMKGGGQLSRWLGKEILKNGSESTSGLLGENMHGLDARQKEQLVQEQVKINKMKEELMKIKKAKLPEVDELDALKKQLEENSFQSRLDEYMQRIDNKMQSDKERLANYRNIRQDLEERGGGQRLDLPDMPAGPRTTEPQAGVRFQQPQPTEKPESAYSEKRTKKDKKKKKKKKRGDSSDDDDSQEEFYRRSSSKKRLGGKGYDPPPPPYYDPYGRPAPPPYGAAPVYGNGFGAPGSQPIMHQDSTQVKLIEQQTQNLKEQQNFMHKQTSDMYNKQMEQMQRIIERQEQEKSRMATQIDDIRKMQQDQITASQKLPESLLAQLKPRTPPPPPGYGAIAASQYPPGTQYPGMATQGMPPEMAMGPVFDQKPHFAQNDERAKDLDDQERALMNIQAQEYDSLMLLSRLNPDSDLYKHKYKQFLQMSQWRTQAEQALQEQRLNRIKDNYGFQKQQVEKKLEEDRLLEGARREMLLRQLRAGADMNQAQHAVNTQMQQSMNVSASPDTLGGYNAKDGFYLMWDFILGHPSSFEAMKATYTITSRRISSPTFIDLPITYASPGPTTSEKNTIFSMQKSCTGVEMDQSALLILQVQGQRLATPHGTQGVLMPIGWSMMDLFVGGKLKVGAWKLPLYLGTPEMSFDVRRVKDLEQEPSKMMFYFRVLPSLVHPLAVAKMNPESNANEYALPQIHQGGVSQIANIVSTGGIHPNFSGKYSVEGVNVFLHQLKNYPGQIGKDITIEADIRLGTEILNDDSGKPCVWRSKSFPSVPGGTMAGVTAGGLSDKVNRMFSRGSIGIAPPTSGSRIKTAERKLPIMQEVSFFSDLYKKVWDAKFAQHVYLIVKVIQGDDLLCFGCHRLDEEGTGQINLGPVDMDMCVPPIQVYDPPRPDHISRFPYIMRVTIGKPVRRAQGLGAPTREDQKQQTKERGGVGSKAVSRSLLSEDGVNYSKYRPAFMFNPDLNYSDELFLKGDGIDIYIPELRFPADSASICKLNTTIIDQFENSLLEQTVKGLADINSSSTMRNIFGFRTQIRNASLSPLSYLYVAVQSINQISESRQILGYGYLPLFINSFDKRPCSDNAQKDYILLEGAYQIPLHQKRINEEDPSPLIIANLAREPVTSLLVVVRKAPKDGKGKVLSIQDVPEAQWKEKGLIYEVPEYETGQYSTYFFKPSIGELESMLLKFNQNKGALKDIIARMVDFQRGGSGKAKAADFQDTDLEQWAMDVLEQGDLSQISYIFHTPYQDHIGFSFQVQRVINVNQKFLWGLVFTIFPPGGYFQDPKQIEKKDIGVVKDLVWDSPARAPIYDSKLKNFKNITNGVELKKYELPMLSENGIPLNMCLIVQLWQILTKTDQNRWEVAGFTIIPLFSRHKYLGDNRIYINTGVYQVPVFKGKILRSQLGFLENQQNPLQYAISCAEKKRNHFQFYENVSIQTLLVDGHIKRVHSSMGMIGFLGDIKNKKLLDKYEYNPIKIKEKMTVETILPRKANKEIIKEGYQNIMNNALLS